MAEIICARHGRTSKIQGGLCVEPRSKWDAAATPWSATLRAALKIPENVCGRVPLPECATCKHPAHAGQCSTIIANSGVGTEWCACAERG